MMVIWNGRDLFKGYFDPKTGSLDLVTSRPVDGGEARTIGEGLTVAVDEEGLFCHLGLDVSSVPETPVFERPADVQEAVDAEVELPEDAAASWSFDSNLGSLCLVFEGVDPAIWGRIGDNLLWLALDDEGTVAAICFEGVSRDPGGKAQATWLEELGL